MKVSELFESLSPVVFHATSVNNAKGIFKNNSINLSPTFTKSSETHNKWNFFLSMTRTRTGSYHLDNSSYSVLIELDGRKLNSNFSGEPVDYWGEDFRRAAGGSYEQEDRLYSNKPEIKDFRKYVKRVDILVSDIKRERSKSNRDVLDLIRTLTKSNIPFRLFSDNRNWVIGGRDMTVEEFMSNYTIDGVRKPFSDEPDNYRNTITYRNDRVSDDLKLVYKLMVVDNISMLDSEERRMMRRYTSQIDARGQVGATLHNASSRQGDRAIVAKIGELMRKNKLRTPYDLADFLVAKWSRS